jgi:tripartite-type tricarboxylate transporter receptor subunit TctC
MPSTIARTAVAGTCLLASVTGALAQNYPSKPIRWIVPTAAGGAYDVVARTLSAQMSASLGQAIVVDNRAAAAGIVGMEAIARAAPDGHTVGTAGVSQLTMHPHIYPKLPYEPRRDFAPIGMMVSLPLALWVGTTVSAKSLKELIAYAKAHPGKLNYGSAGIGHSFHLATELLGERTGAAMTHVPYKGTTPGLQDLVAGRIDVMFYPPTGPVLNQMKDGRLRPLATASEKRFPTLPDVPTFEEAGVRDFDVAGWASLAAAAATPKEIVARLNQELIRAVTSQESAKVYEKMGFIPVTSTAAELAQKIERETRMWGSVIKRLGIKPE